ncbi:beta-1,6-N-acetylglucosaminyltransferase [Dysgonomonas capnocytophagoides]|uniref:beta-1,6-N-acetylglucosaminyltransferase n=1 Tax=Dysgonomonas capnocytophagoides TaxID=45254 RepID=UPI00333E96CB
MKHVILIMAHDNIDYLSNLIQYFDDDFSIYIHLDKKKKISKKELALLKENKTVSLVSQKYKINWGGFNILKAELYLMEKAMVDNNIDYVHLISGQDYPTKSLVEFKSFFNKQRGCEFIEYNELPRKEWENGTFDRFLFFRPLDLFNYRTAQGYKNVNRVVDFQIKKKLYRTNLNRFTPLYGGSAWFSLTKECVKYILEFTKKHPAFYNRLKYTFAPEETYIPTVLKKSIFTNTLNNNNLRYINWVNKNNSYPAILDEKDYFHILKSNVFFARKIDPKTSNKLLKLLNYRINNPPKSENIAKINSIFRGYNYDQNLSKTICFFAKLMEINTIVDFECAPGWYLKDFRDNGFEIDGFDENPSLKYISDFILQDGTCFNQINLIEEINLTKKYDLVVAMREKRKIPRDNNLIFMNNLIQYSNKYILLNWNSENKHTDERNFEGLVFEMSKNGFTENILLKNYLRKITNLKSYKDSLFVFQKI